MKKIAIAIHAGAGTDSAYYHKYKDDMEKGLRQAIEAGYKVLKKKGRAIDAVEAAVVELENNWLFNAGRGSALNAKGEVEMCASIMDGRTLNSGAAAIVKNVRNPIRLAKAIMENTSYIYLGGPGALDYAKRAEIELVPEAYFVTPYQWDEFEKKQREEADRENEPGKEQASEKMHGTVGAVAVDVEGNVAAATSTGGTPYCKEGRIGDSSMVGVGSYANNKTCAVSGTGDGEYLIRGVICHSISEVMRLKNVPLQEACKEVLWVDNKDIKGDMGIISVDTKGNICIEFNSERMPRAWVEGDDEIKTAIY